VATFDPDAILAAMRGDKKVADGRLTFILVRGIGRAFVHREVAAADLRAHLHHAA
jgi:3-dehydroquinate synthase